jgi:hypothetical protein
MEDKKIDLTEIYLMLQDLDKRIAKIEELQSKTEPGVVTEGAPKFVKAYIQRIKEERK